MMPLIKAPARRFGFLTGGLYGAWIAAFPASAFAGVYVDGNHVIIQNVKSRKEVALSSLLPKVKNTGTTTRNFSVTVEPSENLKKGYASLPDIGWFRPKKVTMAIPPGVEASIDGMSLFIPDGYANRHFEASLVVSQESAVTMSVAIPVWIETAGKKTKALPEGEYGFAPSLLEFRKPRKQSLFLVNGSTSVQMYTVFLALPAKGSGSTFLPQSPGFEWLNDESLIEVEIKDQRPLSLNRYEFSLDPRQTVTVRISIRKKPLEENHEAFLVAVQNSTGKWRLARIKIH